MVFALVVDQTCFLYRLFFSLEIKVEMQPRETKGLREEVTFN